MKRLFSAQYIFTGSGPPLKRGIITTDAEGTVLGVEDTAGSLREKRSVEFYNGIIVPGFVNCHSHLELSNLKGTIPSNRGLGDFIKRIRNNRDKPEESIHSSILSADIEMYNEGIVLCGDICNSTASFSVKKKSRISYVNFIEVFGTDPLTAGARMDEKDSVLQKAADLRMPFYLTPHSVYSVSLPLFRLLREKSKTDRVTTIHFMEAHGEREFLEEHSGPILTLYEEAGIAAPRAAIAGSHVAVVLDEISPRGNLILVHNTFADRATVRAVRKRGDLFWCLCPNSNLFIEKTVPPLDLLREEGCSIVTGTDSLASNSRLSILEELRTLQKHFPRYSLEEMIRWATVNGAKALGEEARYGTIEPGKKPGLLLIENVDLIKMKLTDESGILRLI